MIVLIAVFFFGETYIITPSQSLIPSDAVAMAYPSRENATRIGGSSCKLHPEFARVVKLVDAGDSDQI